MSSTLNNKKKHVTFNSEVKESKHTPRKLKRSKNVFRNDKMIVPINQRNPCDKMIVPINQRNTLDQVLTYYRCEFEKIYFDIGKNDNIV